MVAKAAVFQIGIVSPILQYLFYVALFLLVFVVYVFLLFYVVDVYCKLVTF